MFARSDPVADTLDDIISKVETELDNASAYANQSDFEDAVTCTSDVRNKFSCDSIEEINCRICYDPNQEFPIIYPCKCKGTMGAIHLKCLERWLEESNKNSCELCGHEFRVERTPRYKILRSVIIWLCLNHDDHQMYVRSVKTDLLRFLVVTPVTIGCSYVCVVAADFYAMNNYDNFPLARWTIYFLLVLMALLILSFFIWIYLTMQYYQKAWFYWWQKTSIVKIIDLMPTNTTLISNNDKRNVMEV